MSFVSKNPEECNHPNTVVPFAYRDNDTTGTNIGSPLGTPEHIAFVSNAIQCMYGSNPLGTAYALNSIHIEFNKDWI